MKSVSMYEVEDWLPEGMKTLKRTALSGDTEAEFSIGMLYCDLSINTGDKNIADIAARFLARAAKKGHSDAIYFFSNAGMNWHNYDY